MNLFLPELFYQTTTNLNDKEKIFLTSCSKITYNFKSLLILDSEYNFEEVNDKWRVKNIIIKDFSLETKIKELIPEGGEKVGTTFGDPESIVVNSKYVKFISNNTNIKLFHNKKIVKKLVSYGHNYLAMKIMLNNDESIQNKDDLLIKCSRYGYLEIIKLLIKEGVDITNYAIETASEYRHLEIVKFLINEGVDISSADSYSIAAASMNNHLEMIKLLIENGADITANNNISIRWASERGNFEAVKLLIENGADITANNNEAIRNATKYKYSKIVKLLIENGAVME